MTAATVKIKTKLFQNGESIQGLADRWGYSRHLVTKVIHGERSNAAVRRRLARYMGSTVQALFREPERQRKAA